MKIKNYEAINLYVKLGEILKNCSFKASTCLTIIKNKKKLEEIVKTFDETRETLAKSLSEKDENGEPLIENGNYVVSDKKTLAEEFSKLQKIETEVEFSKLSVEDLGESELKGEYVEALSVFIN